MALSNQQKQQALRKRRASEGLKELRGVWMPPELHKEAKELIKELLASKEN